MIGCIYLADWLATFFLSEKYQIFYVLNEYKKLGLVDNVV